ncbi:hypothetical protein HTZ84_06145 [Haloterrigena sp. SYSU A558-1]|uniref:Uncharacterized protein n=1 Tax=Haloterrigena gelatinilytica TaxID=2741724 RepID=A0A8J8KFF2_9EURY|nr:hypothetical protein [Haloterrigena gelatinilytica]NUB92278.1 hypothetical protein [Haloterrigena gelatinilytica]NUC71893.1 hypothetical protein [Haloterrigena gelatinilytica]
MVDEDLELERDIGEATIVYDEPDETVRKSVPNEHIAYFQDHWIIKTGEDDEGRDIVRRIPARRVHYVERTVDEFAEEVETLVDQVQSFASDLRTKIPVGGSDSGESERPEPHRIDVDRGEPSESENRLE